MSLVLISIIILLILSLPIVYVFRRNGKQRRFFDLINKLPGPRCYPIVGTSFEYMITRRNDIFDIGRRRAQKYYPLYRSWFGSTPVIHIMKPEHLESVMNNIQHIQKDLMYNYIRPWLGAGLITANGAKWRKHRKLITPAFHFQILENFVGVFVEKGQMLVNQLRQKADGTVFDIYPFITNCTLDIICVFCITPHGRQFQNYLSILHDFTNKIIRERKAALSAKNNNECDVLDDDTGMKKRKAFLNLLIAASQDGKLLNDIEISEEVNTFVFAGHDTTTTAICWSLFLLGNHPEVQEKAVRELDDIYQDENTPITMAELNKMTYLEKVIKETLRLYPSVPMISRSLKEDVALDGYILPAGCSVLLQIYDVHHNGDYFPDPERFDPDRFLPENCKGRHPFSYIPFSAGPRNCIGRKFAMLEEKVIIAAILRKFKICAVDTQETVKMKYGLILRSVQDIKVTLEQRKNR